VRWLLFSSNVINKSHYSVNSFPVVPAFANVFPVWVFHQNLFRVFGEDIMIDAAIRVPKCQMDIT